MSVAPPARAQCVGMSMLYLLLASPPARAWLESSMTGHMLLQVPLLATIGFLASRLLPQRLQAGLFTGVGGSASCVLVAFFASSYWMLPRALDGALTDPLQEAAKFASLPLLVGLPLGLAWKRLGLIGRGFVWTNGISMLLVLGWLYMNAPVRVCNNYLVDQQEHAGWAMVKLAAVLFAWWLASLFVGGRAVPTEAGVPTAGGIRSPSGLAEPGSSRWTTSRPQD